MTVSGNSITIEGKKGNKKEGIGNQISYLFIIGIYFNEGKEHKFYGKK